MIAASHEPAASPPIGSRDRVLLLLIVLMGAALRLFRLDAQSVWYDETFSVANSVRPLAQLFKILTLDGFQAPLHYLVLHGWFEITGFGATQARLISVIFGTLSIPLLYLLARRFTDSATSLCAAFLLAISQIAVYFSQEARPYAQTQFLTLLAALAFLSFLQNPTLLRSMSFAVASIALLYTHYYGVGTLLALGIYWLIFPRDYSPLVFRRLAAVVVLLVVAYIPWIAAVQSGGRLNRITLINVGPSNTKPQLSSPMGALSRFNNGKFESIEAPTSVPQALLGLAVFTLPAAAALWFTRRAGAQGVVLGCLLAAVPVALSIGLGTLGVIFNYRYFSFAAPGYYLAVAIGWRLCFRNTAARAAWLAIVAVLSGFALRANYYSPTKDDYRGGFRPLAENVHPGDCVSTRPPRWNDKLHFGWEVYYRDRGPLRVVPSESLPSAFMSCERLWVAWDRTWWMNLDQEEAKRTLGAIATLGEHYAVVERYDHPAVELELLQRQPARVP